MLAGLYWEQTIGLPIKMISTDSLSLVQALNNNTMYYDELGLLLTDIQMLLENFLGASINHVSHNFNLAARNLGKQVLQLDNEISQVEEVQS